MPDDDVAVWAQMLAHLRRQHPVLCRQWFEHIEPVGAHDGRFYLRTATPVHRDYLRRSCAGEFSEAAQTATGMLLSVRFLGPGETPDHAAKDNAATSVADESTIPRNYDDAAAAPRASQGAAQGSDDRSRPAERRDGLVINPDYDFEHFVVGPGNRLAHASALAVAQNPGKAYNPLFIHGGVGLGKTHLLQAVCLQISRDNPGAVIHYLSCEGFVTHFMESVQAGRMADFRHHFREVDVLVIDDIHFLAKRDRTQEEFFHTFNSLYQANKQIILSSDAAPQEIPDLEDRLVSRFKWGMVSDVQPPCYETRVAILKSKAKIRGLEMPEPVACFIAQHIDTNIRELEGAITKLQVHAAIDGSELDLALAARALGIGTEPPPRVNAQAMTMQEIIDTVTDFYSVRPQELLSRRRTRSVALPRQICMYLARANTRHSLEEIGVYLGNRDHTTVMHAVRAITARRAEDRELDQDIRSIEAQLSSAAAAG